MNPVFQELAAGLRFPEGPVAMNDGSTLVTEIAGGAIKRIAADGAVSIVAETGGGPNGLAVGPDGALYVCNNGGNQYQTGNFLPVGPASGYRGGYIQRVDPLTGRVRILYDQCGPNKLSAPNDIVFDRHGGFYFTDLGKRRARDRDHGGLYYAMPDGSFIREVAYPMHMPNGVGLSPDEKTIYVVDTDAARLWAFDVKEPGVVHRVPFPAHGGRLIGGHPGLAGFDSLAVDSQGNICVATLLAGSISIFSPDGHIVGEVSMPDDHPTNICFGGDDLMTAFVTLARSGKLISMKWRVPGLRLNYYG